MEGSPPVNVRRRKFIWRVFLISNFAIGAYMFAWAGKKEREKKKSEIPYETAAVAAAVTAAIEEPVVSPSISRPVIVRQPIPEDQQGEIFKWILEEKRKVKPQNREEKKRIDEEKAILKEFIRSKPVPSI